MEMVHFTLILISDFLLYLPLSLIVNKFRLSVNLDYNQLTGRNLSSLMVVATGTAVVVE